MTPGAHFVLDRLNHPELLAAFAPAQLLRRLGPHGGARTIPVAEYLEARVRGDAEIPPAFFGGLLLRNGVYKTTYPNRMNDLFPSLIDRARGLPQRPLRCLDVACSSGISTLEMYQAFERAGIPTEAWGTDLMLFARQVRRADGCGLLFDRDENVLQVDVEGWATPWTLRPRDLALRPMRWVRARRLMRDEVQRFRVALHHPLAGYSVVRVPLVAWAAEHVPGVQFVEEDILHPALGGPFGVIRAANILNLGYFGADQIRAMAAALSARLTEGGLLLVTRTEGAKLTNRGTMFRWAEGRLRVEERTNGGSEITDLLA
jgi:hypothetical protein